MEEIDIQQTVEDVSRWINSEEGRRRLEENLTAAAEENRRRREAMRIPTQLLYEPMTL